MHVFLCLRYRDAVRGTAHEIPEWVPLAEVRNLNLLPNMQGTIREGEEIRTAVPT